MIAVDTNILVYAHVTAFDKHELARDALVELAEGAAIWGIPSPCLAEFMRVVTHPRILHAPFSVPEAVAALDAVMQSPSLRVLLPAEQHWLYMQSALSEADARGNLAFDAMIAAICSECGVTTLLTEDRDFHRFAAIPTKRLG